MKFAFTLKNKLKIAFLLFCIMCCILLIRFLEDKSVSKINESFISMYHDRLVPATDLYYVAENLYHKNAVIQDALADQMINSTVTKAKVQRHNRKIDSVINKYELTLLVKQEKSFLRDLKRALLVQQAFEEEVLSSTTLSKKDWYASAGDRLSRTSLDKLSALIRIQSKVGDELIKDTRIFVSGTKIYSTLQVILAVIIGVMIVSIVSASNMVKVQNDKFNLN